MILGALLFVAAVVFHRRVKAELTGVEERARLSEIGIARMQRDWETLPIVLSRSVHAHRYADDLDLFGAPSVTQLFGPVRTLFGARTLRAWMEEPAGPEQVSARQHAVRELSTAIEFRESLAVRASDIPRASHRRVEAFLTWMNRTPPPISPIMTIAARGLPILTFALIAAAVSELIAPVWIYLPVSAAVLLNIFMLPRAYRAFDAAFTAEPAPLNYAATFAAAETAPASAPLLATLQSALRDGDGTASGHIKRLEQIMHSSDARRAGIFAFILEALFLWSLNVLIELQRWQRSRGSHARGWFDALGHIEALSSIATLAHDHPEWCYPQVDINATTIEAKGLGHPMLRDDVRVTNDTVIGPRGTVLLVTGSNMSGKSTLLRAVGVNTVLAHAGAPVCATSYMTPVLHLYTSINVRDSLAMGASLYMAQLARLKEIVDAARTAPHGHACCYLLDEILSGTNSADRTTAVRAVVHELLQLNAIGALTTHDLALAADERIMRNAVPVHFAETIDSAAATMTFDYRMRPGVVQSSNALALMRLMGFRIDD